MELKRVVVTGLGAVTPLGNTVPELWGSILNGQSGAAPITLFDTEKFKVRFACEVKNFDPSQVIDRKELRKTDRFTQFVMVAADEALRDANVDLETIDCDRVGVILGVGTGGLKSFEDEIIGYAADRETVGPRLSPFFIPKYIPSMAAGLVSIKYGFRGVNFVTTSACASSTNALIDACNYIRLGKADMIVSGGSEAAVTVSGIGGFSSMHALSTRNDSPETASRPFSASRDGFVLGEGGAVLVLEEYGHAVARGAKIYAELVGCGLSADAFHMTAPDPDGKGAARVMRDALNDAQMNPEDIDYINVHGTSTPLGDVSELKAVKEVFGDWAYKLNISSTKSMTGHLLGAAGALEALLSVKAVECGIVPPTINHAEDDCDENIDYNLNLTFNKPQKRELRAVLSNTFGFGGHNASVIFKKL